MTKLAVLLCGSKLLRWIQRRVSRKPCDMGTIISETSEKYSLLNLSKCWLRDSLRIAFKYVLMEEIAHRLFCFKVANVASLFIYETKWGEEKERKREKTWNITRQSRISSLFTSAIHSKVSGLLWEEVPLIPISLLGQLLCFGDIGNISEYEVALSRQQFSNLFQDLIC